jgi:soluble methane monooxygenase-binding protein MmoD
MISMNEAVISSAILKDDLAASTDRAMAELTGASKAPEQNTAGPSADHVFLTAAGRYTAYAIDLDFLWRWEIYHLEEDHMIQDGVSLSLASATEAVGHVLAYFSVRDSNAMSGACDAARA